MCLIDCVETIISCRIPWQSPRILNRHFRADGHVADMEFFIWKQYISCISSIRECFCYWLNRCMWVRESSFGAYLRNVGQVLVWYVYSFDQCMLLLAAVSCVSFTLAIADVTFDIDDLFQAVKSIHIYSGRVPWGCNVCSSKWSLCTRHEFESDKSYICQDVSHRLFCFVCLNNCLDDAMRKTTR